MNTGKPTGFEQIYVVSYDQRFASVVKSTSFKILLTMMAYHDTDCKYIDVIKAFLNAVIKDGVSIPPRARQDAKAGLKKEVMVLH